MYVRGCSILRLAEFQVPHTRRRMAGDKRPDEVGRWRSVVVETMTSVENIV